MQGMSPGMYEAKVRASLATQIIPEAISNTTLVSDADVDAFFRLRLQQRDLRYVELPRPSLTDATVSDADIDAFYKSHIADYTTPEQVSVQYLEVKQSELKVGEPTDEQLHAFYDKFKQRYAQPEQREASHILINVPKNATPDQQKAALEKAKKIAAEATPENFAKLAAENSDDLGSKRTGGDLGWLEKGVANAAFDTALFGMKKGDVTKEPVLSPEEGYHIIWLRDAREGDAKPFAEVRAQLAADWAKGEGERLYNERAGQLADLADRNPGSLEPAAKELGLEIKTSPLFGREGGAGIPTDPKFVAGGFRRRRARAGQQLVAGPDRQGRRRRHASRQAQCGGSESRWPTWPTSCASAFSMSASTRRRRSRPTTGGAACQGRRYRHAGEGTRAHAGRGGPQQAQQHHRRSGPDPAAGIHAAAPCRRQALVGHRADR